MTTEGKKVAKASRRAMRLGLQELIVGGLRRKYGPAASEKRLRRMAKQMAQGEHPEMGIKFHG